MVGAAAAYRRPARLRLKGFIIGGALIPVVALGVGVKLSIREAPSAGGTATLRFGAPSFFVNPLLAESDTDMAISSILFPGLLSRNASGALANGLTRSWHVSAGGTRYVFHLRPGLTWQNHEPLMSYDVAYTYRLLASPAFPAHTDQWSGVRVFTPDARTVIVRLRRPDYTFGQAATVGIVPNHFANSSWPVGSGSFRVLSVSRHAIQLGADPPPTGSNSPYLSTVSLLTPPASRVAADLTCRSTFGSVAGSTTVPTTRLLGLLINSRALPQLAVRRALVAALARARSTIPMHLSTPTPVWPAAPTPSLLTQPGRPRQILLRAGWHPGVGGWRRRHVIVDIRLVDSTEVSQDRFVDEIARIWRRDGFRVSVFRLPYASLARSILYPGKFGAAIVEWDFGGPDYAPSTLWGRNAPLNFGGFDGSSVDRMSNQVITTPTLGRRDALRIKIGIRLLDEGEAVGLAPEEYACRVSPHLHGFRFPTLVTDAGGLMAGIQNWYVDRRLILHNPF